VPLEPQPQPGASPTGGQETVTPEAGVALPLQAPGPVPAPATPPGPLSPPPPVAPSGGAAGRTP
jgi:hypothetical protein